MAVSQAQTVALGKNQFGRERGRMAAEHAASLTRVDRDVKRLTGRVLDVNSAWRSPVTQQQLYDAYLRFLRSGRPWAPIALPPNQSVHCNGGAVDTDDHGIPGVVPILNQHGWFQTVYRTVNGRRTLVEPWHFERFRERDEHATGGASVAALAAPEPPAEEEDPMGVRLYESPTANGLGRVRALGDSAYWYVIPDAESLRVCDQIRSGEVIFLDTYRDLQVARAALLHGLTPSTAVALDTGQIEALARAVAEKVGAGNFEDVVEAIRSVDFVVLAT